jgi:hypothetical protein
MAMAAMVFAVVALLGLSPLSGEQQHLAPVAASEAQPAPADLSAPHPDPQLEAIPWKERSWQQRFLQSNYDDEFTFKHRQIFEKDPFVWAVSREFAERFGMPEAWIDPGLKGALAVAWRTTNIGQEACGYGRNPDACWPPFTCQMDIYVDSSAPIPWRFDQPRHDFMWAGVRSLDYVPRRLPAPARSRYNFAPNKVDGSKGWPFYTTAFSSKSSPYHAGGSGISLTYFDRDYAPGVTLLGFRNGCPDPRVKKDVIFRFFSAEEQERKQGLAKNFAHTIEFSDAFMDRISSLYMQAQEEHKKLNTARRQIMDRIFQQKP